MVTILWPKLGHIWQQNCVLINIGATINSGPVEVIMLPEIILAGWDVCIEFLLTAYCITEWQLTGSQTAQRSKGYPPEDPETQGHRVGVGKLKKASKRGWSLSRRASKLRLHIDPVRRAGVQGRGEEEDCGICELEMMGYFWVSFEHAWTPTRTRCCGSIFCAEHISTRLHGPTADGLCPACRPDSPASASTPALSPSSSTSSSSYTSLSASSSSSSPNDEDYAFPAAALRSVLDLQSLRARTSNEKSPWHNSDLDTDESADPDTKETLSSFLETRNILLALARAAGCVLVVGILAGRGHWV
ncbi:hypothetical protein C8R44DRAFT_724420 [Mycena epipterygia]|nr:hypothetical protein C8R44DRAFT_724420 [Mycena epipterygia]